MTTWGHSWGWGRAWRRTRSHFDALYTNRKCYFFVFCTGSFMHTLCLLASLLLKIKRNECNCEARETVFYDFFSFLRGKKDLQKLIENRFQSSWIAPLGDCSSRSCRSLNPLWRSVFKMQLTRSMSTIKRFFKWAKPSPFLLILVLFTLQILHKFDYKC